MKCSSSTIEENLQIGKIWFDETITIRSNLEDNDNYIMKSLKEGIKVQ